jgi:hypothetical protein
MSLLEPLLFTLVLRLREALIRGAIWAFVGLLYAMLFVFFSVFASYWKLPAEPYFVALLLSGTIGAIIYSSMRLAVFMAGLLFPISILYFTLNDGNITLGTALKILLPAGLLIGGLYSLFAKGSRIDCADAKSLAGFTIGSILGIGYLLAEPWLKNLPLPWLIAIACPVTGMLYVSVVPTFIKLYRHLLPPVGDGALVGGFVSIFIAFCSFVMASSIDNSMAGALLPEVEQVLERLPSAMLGGLLGAGLAGVISGLTLREWQDL